MKHGEIGLSNLDAMTAKDLLLKILDYHYLWANHDRINSKPSAVRKAQIDALQTAFGLTKQNANPLIEVKYFVTGDKAAHDRATHLRKLSNLEYLMRGEFLKDRPYESNQELTSKVVSTIRLIHQHLPASYTERPVDIGWLFNNLMRFRQEIYKVTYPNGGMLEGFSVGLHYSFYLQSRIKQLISENIHEIDGTLWMILDPQRRTIEKDELVSSYNYPDVDLEKIDREWSIENY